MIMERNLALHYWIEDEATLNSFKISIWSHEQTLLSITYIIAAIKASVTFIMSFFGCGIVAPWTLWAVHANANLIGN